MEIWRYIKGHGRFYKVSNFGRIKSFKSGVERMMKFATDSDGYYQLNLYNRRGKTTKKVHRLVLESFIGDCPDGYQTGHLDGNKKNNNLINLQWVTPAENGYHKILHGTAATGCRNGAYTHPEKVRRGSQINTSKLSKEQAIYIKKTAQKGNYSLLGKKFGVSHTAIRYIAIGKNWKELSI